MTNWTERDIEIDFSFLGNGNYEVAIFKDGLNADKDATTIQVRLSQRVILVLCMRFLLSVPSFNVQK
jgi:Glycosyl-hydrolase 97 C-terminal, oligomerisation